MLRLRRLPRLPRPAGGRALPGPLRARLLAIPDLSQSPAAAIVPRTARGALILEWMWTAPLLPLAASLALSTTLGLAWGNPHRLGTAAIERVRHGITPVSATIRSEANAIGTAASGIARRAVAVVPGASLKASRILTANLTDWIDDDRRPRP